MPLAITGARLRVSKYKISLEFYFDGVSKSESFKSPLFGEVLVLDSDRRPGPRLVLYVRMHTGMGMGVVGRLLMPDQTGAGGTFSPFQNDGLGDNLPLPGAWKLISGQIRAKFPSARQLI